MARFNLNAIRVKNPNLFKTDTLVRSLEKVFNEAGDGVKADLEKTTTTWSHKVSFVKRIGIRGGTVTVYAAGANAKIYTFVDAGTKSHIIRAKRGPFLRFQQSYSPKTTPGVVGSRQGGASGGFRFAKEVKHPGTKARDFTKLIQKEWQPKFSKMVLDALKKSGAI